MRLWTEHVIAPLFIGFLAPESTFSFSVRHRVRSAPPNDRMGHQGPKQNVKRPCCRRDRGYSLFPSAAAAGLATFRRCAASTAASCSCYLCAHRHEHDHGRILPISADTSTTVAGEAAEIIPATGTRYTINVGVHPDVATLAVKHARQLPRFLEHHPISNHTREAYSRAVAFVRDFHISRRNLDGEFVEARGKWAGSTGVYVEEAGKSHKQTHHRQQRWRPRERHPFPVVLDSGCGTGRSTAALARYYPHLPVLGVDRSAMRLARGMSGYDKKLTPRGGRCVEAGKIDAVDENTRITPRRSGGAAGGGYHVEDPPANILLLRADLVSLWILASRDGAWEVVEHAILYPNPYPKRSQLRSRWHGHPVFPIILSLGGRITLRSNWKAYLEEVCRAVLAIAHASEDVDRGDSPPSLIRLTSSAKSGGGATSKKDASSLGRDNHGFQPVSSNGHCQRASGRGRLAVLEDTVAPPGVPVAVAAAAASYAPSAREGASLFLPMVPATNFEAKYKTVGEAVYELRLEPRSFVEID